MRSALPFRGDRDQFHRDDWLADADSPGDPGRDEAGQLGAGDKAAGEEIGGEHQQSEVAGLQGLVDGLAPQLAGRNVPVGPFLKIAPGRYGESGSQELEQGLGQLAVRVGEADEVAQGLGKGAGFLFLAGLE